MAGRAAVPVQVGQDKMNMQGEEERGGRLMAAHGKGQVAHNIWHTHHAPTRRRPLVRKWRRSGAAAQQAGAVVTPMPGRIVKVWPLAWFGSVWRGLARAAGRQRIC